MVTPVIYLKKSIQVFSLFFILATLTGCPGQEDCDDLASDITVPNLAIITPLQEVYQQGDEIILSLIIPSENNYFGNTIDIFQETGDENPLIFGDNNLFLDNEIIITKGTQGEFNNQFHLQLINNIYELEVIITLNRIGSYSHNGIYKVDFQGENRCNRYRIETNIQGVNTQYQIEFEVI